MQARYPVHSRLRLLLMTVLLCGISACANVNRDASSISDKTVPVLTPLLAYDRELGYHLDVTHASAKMAGKLMQFEVLLKNDWHSELKFHYKVVWYDQNGMEIKSQASEDQEWKMLTLASQDEKLLVDTSPVTSGRDFMIHVKN